MPKIISPDFCRAAFSIPGARGRATSTPAYPLRSCAGMEAAPPFRTCSVREKGLGVGLRPASKNHFFRRVGG